MNRSRNRQLYDAALCYHGTWRAALAIRREFRSWANTVDLALSLPEGKS